MVRALGVDPHLLERQTNLTAHVLSFIERRDIHISRIIIGNTGVLCVAVRLEQIELQLGFEVEAISL